MCLGIPARITVGDTGHPDLAAVDMGGVTRVVNIGLLDEPPRPGDWILVHMGFALSTMTAEEAADALAALGAEREAEDREAAHREAADAADRGAADFQAVLDAVEREVAEREAARGAL
jgi:hydrogenase expression/formation protein HypC